MKNIYILGINLATFYVSLICW